MKKSNAWTGQRVKREQDRANDRIPTLPEGMVSMRIQIAMGLVLPPEILSLVFSFVKVRYEAWIKRQTSFRYIKPLDWIRSTTHVCKHWRSVALSSPSLWTSGFPRGLYGIRVFLERSGNLPIIFDQNITSAMLSSPQVYSLVYPHIHRAGELYIVVPNRRIPKALFILNHDMPHLKALHVDLSERLTPGFRSPPVIPIPRPAILKNVHDLKLECFGFRWDQIEMSNLTRLDISGDAFSTDICAPVQQVLTVIRSSPKLIFLRLWNGIRDDPDTKHSSTSAAFCLPELEGLFLKTDGTTLAKNLLNSKVLPKVEEVSVDVSASDQSTMTNILHSFAQATNRNPLSHIGFSVMKKDRKVSLRFEAYARPNKARILFYNTWDDNHAFNLPLDILKFTYEYNLDRLREFRCDSIQSLSKEWWYDVLYRAPMLETLCIDSLEDPRGFISALEPESTLIREAGRWCIENASSDGNEMDKDDDNEDYGDNEGNDDGQDDKDGLNAQPISTSTDKQAPFLPLLTTLTLGSITFSSPSILHHPSAANPNQPQYVDGSLDHLAHCLEQRLKCGFMLMNLDLLYLSDDQQKSDSVSRLKGFVSHIIVSNDGTLCLDPDLERW